MLQVYLKPHTDAAAIRPAAQWSRGLSVSFCVVWIMTLPGVVIPGDHG